MQDLFCFPENTYSEWQILLSQLILICLHINGFERKVRLYPAGMTRVIGLLPDSMINDKKILAYAIFRGIKGGWLDRSYLKHAIRMRNATHKKVDHFGLVQGVCGAPDFNRPGTATEGQAFFLLMEAAYKDLFLPEKHE
jgi:hypothetical protein